MTEQINDRKETSNINLDPETIERSAIPPRSRKKDHISKEKQEAKESKIKLRESLHHILGRKS